MKKQWIIIKKKKFKPICPLVEWEGRIAKRDEMEGGIKKEKYKMINNAFLIRFITSQTKIKIPTLHHKVF